MSKTIIWKLCLSLFLAVIYYLLVSKSATSYLYHMEVKVKFNTEYNSNEVVNMNYEVKKKILDFINKLEPEKNIANVKYYLLDRSVNYDVNIFVPEYFSKKIIQDKTVNIFNQYPNIKSVVVHVDSHRSLPSKYKISLILGAFLMFVMLYFSLPIRI